MFNVLLIKHRMYMKANETTYLSKHFESLATTHFTKKAILLTIIGHYNTKPEEYKTLIFKLHNFH